MNAKEAKERALWRHLPHTLKDKIDGAVGQGELDAVYFYSNKILGEDINSIYNTLEELGYTVMVDNNIGVLRISWS